MLRDDNTPRRERVIQGDAYEEAGQPGFSFSIIQPFVASDFEAVAARLAISASGLALQANQVFTENLGNNMAARVKKAVKDKTELPTQADMDTLSDSYDFSGTRVGGAAFGSPYERHFHKRASALIRQLLKSKGYQDIAAPVTVAKRGVDAGDQQIDHETFTEIVSQLINGEGNWGSKDAFINIRETLSDEARAEADAEAKAAQAAQAQLESLDLS